MNRPEQIHQQAAAFFEQLWAQGDPWHLKTSPFEQARFARLAAMLAGREYARVLELGCGEGSFTRHLAPLAGHIVALDISPAAIARARQAAAGKASIDFRIANIMEFELGREGPWDLIVMAETIYYLGWLYPFFDVGWLAGELWGATRPGGRLLLANTFGHVDEDPLILPSLINTYHDLFVNVGYRREKEEVFRSTKDGCPLEVLMTLFEHP